jgi:hypothetical protein
MLGIRYFIFAAILIGLGALLDADGDARASATMTNIVSKIQIECNKLSFEAAGVQVGCRSFADVRKIEMRADNRNRSTNGDHIVQVGR